MPSSNQSISSAAIIGDKNCIYCGQSLAGVSSQDRCPGCGKPAGYSLLGDHLRDAESTWTRSVVLGIDIAMGAFGILAVFKGIDIFKLLDPAETMFETKFFRVFLALIGWLALLVAVALMTGKETSDSLLARRRGVAISLLGATLIYILLAFIPEDLLARLDRLYGAEAVLVVTGLCLVISQANIWILLRRVIDRTPRREVARQLKLMFWVSLIIFLCDNQGTKLLLSRLQLPQQTSLIIALTLSGAVLLQRIAAIYMLLITRKAIRRTVGYWDS